MDCSSMMLLSAHRARPSNAPVQKQSRLHFRPRGSASGVIGSLVDLPARTAVVRSRIIPEMARAERQISVRGRYSILGRRRQAVVVEFESPSREQRGREGSTSSWA